MSEDWDEERFKFPVKKILIIALCILAFSIPTYAVYKITSPASDPAVVNTPATLSKPTLNTTTAIIGDTIQISVALSDLAPGQQITFFQNDIQIGIATTDSNGQAIFNQALTAAGTYIYHATCIHY